jgi:hypothetical protein
MSVLHTVNCTVPHKSQYFSEKIENVAIMSHPATTHTIRHNSLYKVGVNAVTEAKVVIHLDVPIGILELIYQVYLYLMYQISR